MQGDIMNIFALSRMPDIAAQKMCDQHVRSKMIVETGQILANCYKLETLQQAPLTQKGRPRVYSYYNHPCCKWARETIGNFKWLSQHGLALVEERQFRWPDSRPHFTAQFIEWTQYHDPDNLDQNKNVHLTDFYQAFGQENQELIQQNPVKGYQLYYNRVKRHTINPTWTKRNIPTFYAKRSKHMGYS